MFRSEAILAGPPNFKWLFEGSGTYENPQREVHPCTFYLYEPHKPHILCVCERECQSVTLSCIVPVWLCHLYTFFAGCHHCCCDAVCALSWWPCLHCIMLFWHPLPPVFVVSVSLSPSLLLLLSNRVLSLSPFLFLLFSVWHFICCFLYYLYMTFLFSLLLCINLPNPPTPPRSPMPCFSPVHVTMTLVYCVCVCLLCA